MPQQLGTGEVQKISYARNTELNRSPRRYALIVYIPEISEQQTDLRNSSKSSIQSHGYLDGLVQYFPPFHQAAINHQKKNCV